MWKFYTGACFENGYFTAISSTSVKTVADMHRHGAYHKKHYSDELTNGVSTSMIFSDFEFWTI